MLRGGGRWRGGVVARSPATAGVHFSLLRLSAQVASQWQIPAPQCSASEKVWTETCTPIVACLRASEEKLRLSSQIVQNFSRPHHTTQAMFCSPIATSTFVGHMMHHTYMPLFQGPRVIVASSTADQMLNRYSFSSRQEILIQTCTCPSTNVKALFIHWRIALVSFEGRYS